MQAVIDRNIAMAALFDRNNAVGLKYHSHICVECSTDYDPNWLICQRCSSRQQPVLKDKQDKKR